MLLPIASTSPTAVTHARGYDSADATSGVTRDEVVFAHESSSMELEVKVRANEFHD